MREVYTCFQDLTQPQLATARTVPPAKFGKKKLFIPFFQILIDSKFLKSECIAGSTRFLPIEHGIEIHEATLENGEVHIESWREVCWITLQVINVGSKKMRNLHLDSGGLRLHG